MSFEIINPEALGAPRGYNHGMVAAAGRRLLFVAGQTARDDSGQVSSDSFVEQFALALDHVLTVVREAGGAPDDIGRMTVYVTDLDAYRAGLKELGKAYRERMGSHYPAMTLVEVKGLVDEGALVEIEATAALS